MSNWNRLGLSGALLALGCGTQVSSEYFGEALLGLRGRVVVDNAEAPQELVPVLAFQRPREGALPNTYLLEDVLHRGQFPARFELSVVTPPPAAALQTFTTASGEQVTYAWAQIGAVAPEHPLVLAMANLREASYCMGRECYTERSRCDRFDDCYFEREHCSLPSWYDALVPQASLCHELATGGDISAVPGHPDAYARFDSGNCDGSESSCEHTFEWCAVTDDIEPHPSPENCFSRTIGCIAERLPKLPPDFDASRWPERTDLTNCGIVSQHGNLDYAANPNEWLAGISDDVFVVYVEPGFDGPAFEQVTGVPAPELPGYSTYVLEPWNDANLATYETCRDRDTTRLIDDYNLANGTSYSAEEGVDISTELGESLLLAMNRCSYTIRGSWLSDAGTELTLHVGLPPAEG